MRVRCHYTIVISRTRRQAGDRLVDCHIFDARTHVLAGDWDHASIRFVGAVFELISRVVLTRIDRRADIGRVGKDVTRGCALYLWRTGLRWSKDIYLVAGGVYDV